MSAQGWVPVVTTAVEGQQLSQLQQEQQLTQQQLQEQQLTDDEDTDEGWRQNTNTTINASYLEFLFMTSNLATTVI
jgi:hypothetical protein